MKLHTLPKVTTKAKRRLGRGIGSGRGKTAGRGTKGQKARESIRLGFEGGQLRLIKRLPLLRGRSRNKAVFHKPIVVNIKFLNLLPANTTVNLESLVKHRIVDETLARAYGIKILGDGELTAKLEVALPTSQGARKKIEAAGGKVV